MLFKKFQLANNLFCKTLTWVVLAAFLFSTACTTARVIKAQPNAVKSELKTGNPARITTENGSNVKVTTKDGSNFEFRIVEASSEGVIGYKLGNQVHGAPQQTILFSDIASLHPQGGSGGGISAGAVVVIIILGIVVIVALTADCFLHFGDEHEDNDHSDCHTQ